MKITISPYLLAETSLTSEAIVAGLDASLKRCMEMLPSVPGRLVTPCKPKE